MASIPSFVRPVLSVAAAAALLLTPAVYAEYAPAQDSPVQEYPVPKGEPRAWSDDDIPAHLAIVDGEVTIERDGRAEAAAENIILLAGDRLRTGRGRAEVLYADGSALDLDYDSSVDLLDDALVRLVGGRMRLSIARSNQALDYRVDTVAGSAFIRAAGEYRLTLSARASAPELDLVVLRGSAELANDYGRTIVRAGTHALVSTRTAPSLPFPSNSASWDVFDRWVEDQRDARIGATSAQYLPEDLRYYGGAFDQYGSWGYEPEYGRVWYPSVHSSWRPYSHGRWSFVGHFGWTWIGIDRWSWPTHHYGRWGFKNRWYWIPDRRWSPAWVSWALAPGYVSWCPLGFDGRPAISFVNVHVTRIDPWIGWTVVPTRSFRTNVIVSRYAAAREAVAPGIWGQFAMQRTAPVRPVVVQAREVRPLRAPTAVRGYAMPRDGAARGAISTGQAARSSQVASAPSSRTAGTRTAPAQTTGSGDLTGRSAGASSRVAAPRSQPQTPGITRDAIAPSRSAAPSRTIAPSRSATPSRGIDSSRSVAPPRDSSAARARSRASDAPPPVASPSIRSRQPEPQAGPPPQTLPSRAFRTREPEPQPAVRPEMPSRQPSGSAWGRSRSSDPGPAPAPSSRGSAPTRQRMSPPPASAPPPAASRPSGGGWGSASGRSRVSPPSAPPSSSSPAARPSRGGESRAPAARQPSSSSGSGGSGSRAAVRRGGGGG